MQLWGVVAANAALLLAPLHPREQNRGTLKLDALAFRLNVLPHHSH
jgi:hypothetical protein